MRAILQATGPVTANGRSVDADNVIPELLHDQYVRFNNPDPRQRHEELSVIATEAVDALQSGAWSPSRLASGLADAGRVWIPGESSDRWHAAAGGGLWLAWQHRRANTLSIALARSPERTATYVRVGFMF